MEERNNKRRSNGSKLSFRNDESKSLSLILITYYYLNVIENYYLLGYSSDESGEFVYERCLEHLSIVWCAQVTDDCISALQGIPT